jgi:hypothetical protein
MRLTQMNSPTTSTHYGKFKPPASHQFHAAAHITLKNPQISPFPTVSFGKNTAKMIAATAPLDKKQGTLNKT